MNIPNHVAIIPDGNRRWAKARNLPTFEGHRRGFDTATKISRYLRLRGVHTLTFWAFSTENWKRSRDETSYLMDLYAIMIDKYLSEAIRDDIRIVHLGRKDRIPESLCKKIEDAQEKTKNNSKHVLNVALDYGGPDEIIRSIKRIYDLRFKIDDLDENNFSQFLDTHDQPYPNPDLIIRTSGEMRTSGLMIWQAAYAEYIFLEKHFPDIIEKDIDYALQEYDLRQRRFGQ